MEDGHGEVHGQLTVSQFLDNVLGLPIYRTAELTRSL